MYFRQLRELFFLSRLGGTYALHRFVATFYVDAT
jgi:hypothetical protein